MNVLFTMLRATWVPLSVLLVAYPAVAADGRLDPEIEKVFRERLAVLQEAALLRREANRTGTVGLRGMLEADQAVLQAELELATSTAERIRIREESLKIAETLERAVEQMANASEVPRLDLLGARANRLRAAADLLIERKAAAR